MTQAFSNPSQRVLLDFKNAATQITSFGRDAEEVETIEMIADSIRPFGERNIDEARIDAEARIPPDLLQKMAEMGLFGLTIEKEYGDQLRFLYEKFTDRSAAHHIGEYTDAKMGEILRGITGGDENHGDECKSRQFLGPVHLPSEMAGKNLKKQRGDHDR